MDSATAEALRDINAMSTNDLNRFDLPILDPVPFN